MNNVHVQTIHYNMYNMYIYNYYDNYIYVHTLYIIITTTENNVGNGNKT